MRARGYPMEAEIVNGDDVLEMREAVRHAVDRAREGRACPFFLEAKTYRFRGHSMADPAKYRTKEEVQKWMERDPIQRPRRSASQTLGIATEEQLRGARRRGQGRGAGRRRVRRGVAAARRRRRSTEHVYA